MDVNKCLNPYSNKVKTGMESNIEDKCRPNINESNIETLCFG